MLRFEKDRFFPCLSLVQFPYLSPFSLFSLIFPCSAKTKNYLRTDAVFYLLFGSVYLHHLPLGVAKLSSPLSSEKVFYVFIFRLGVGRLLLIFHLILFISSSVEV